MLSQPQTLEGVVVWRILESYTNPVKRLDLTGHTNVCKPEDFLCKDDAIVVCTEATLLLLPI